MPIQIRYATESDAPALAAINIACFKHHTYWHNAFPNIPPATIYPLKQARCLEKLAVPGVHVLCAVDTDINKVVAYARYSMPVGFPPSVVELSAEAQREVAGAGGMVPAGTNVGIYENFFDRLGELRKVHVGGEDIALDFLATAPEYQGKGIASLLLQWGTDLADAQNARIYLEASQDGLPLYLKKGWEKLEDLVLDFEPFGGVGTATYVLMMRGRCLDE